MRTKYTVINFSFGLLNQLLIGIFNIVLRRILIDTVGINYLGINGLFSNILALLNLAESGFGTAIIFKLYRPIAENDQIKISKLLKFYAKIYKGVALFVLTTGCLMTPFLKYIIKDNTFHNKVIILYFVLFLLDTVASYFLAYKSSFLIACQKQYMVVICNTITNSLFIILKIICLLSWENYSFYLLLIIFNTIINNVVVSLIVGKRYNYLQKYKNVFLEEEEKVSIIENVKSLMFHKFGAYILTGTDNIVMSMLVGLKAVGIYSNYITVINMLNRCISQLFNAIVPAMGDIIAEDKIKNTHKAYDTFKMIYFISYIIYGYSSIVLFVLIQPFIEIWLGSNYKLSSGVVSVIILNYYFGGMRTAPNTTKNASGIFKPDRFSPIGEAILNIMLSVVLTLKYGIIGVMLGTLISGLCFPFWTAPYYVYRDLFQRKFIEYLLLSLKYAAFSMIGCIICSFVISKIVIYNSLMAFIVKAICVGICAGGYIIVTILSSSEKHYLKFVLFIWKNLIKKRKENNF